MVLDSIDKDRKKTVKYIKQLVPSAEIRDYSDGRKALEAALDKPPYILMTEVLCNGLDGLFMAKELRDKKMRVNIIFTTARKNSEKYALDFIHMQASYCIDKPLNIGLMSESLRKLRFPIERYDRKVKEYKFDK